MSSTPTHASDRLHGLDALRGGALLLGVVLHGSMAYLPTPIWPFPDPSTSPIASGLFFVIHAFRMMTFFLIAGLFAHAILSRRGAAAFLRDRMSRIAGPLVAMWLIVFPSVIGVILWKVAIDNGGALPADGPPPPPLTLSTFPLLHLWFLWMLLILYAALLGGRWVVKRLIPGAAFGRVIDRAVQALIGPWAPATMALPLALALWATPDWIPFLGIPTPDRGFVPNPAALTAFGLAFLLGAALDRRRDLLARIERLWPVFLLAGVGLAAAALAVAGGPSASLEPRGDTLGKAAAAGLYALAGWNLTFAALALSLRFLSGFSRLRRYLADASYWIYIVHLPMVMVSQVLLMPVPVPWWSKLAIGVLGVTVVGLASYELLVRHTFLGRMLNGRRVPWRRQTEAAALPAE